MSSENATQEAAKQQFMIQRIYIKNAQYVAPLVPQIFKEEWSPKVSLDFDTESNLIEDNLYESVLKIVAKVEVGENKGFEVTVEQAGLFLISGFEQENIDKLLGYMCPEILYPYARECISDLVSKGGFPQFLLAPMNFEAFYEQRKANNK